MTTKTPIQYESHTTEEIKKFVDSLEKKNRQQEALINSMGIGLSPELPLNVRLAVQQHCIITKLRDFTEDDNERNEAILNHLYQLELKGAFDIIEVKAREMVLTQGQQPGGLFIPGRG